MSYQHDPVADEAKRQEIISYLTQTAGFKETGKTLYIKRCPVCDVAKGAFTYTEKPYNIYCNRTNNCGTHKTVDIFPQAVKTVVERHTPKLKENRNAIADGYLTDIRSFSIASLKGSYAQEFYKNPNADKSTYTIRWTIPETDAFFERFVETVMISDPNSGDTTPRKSRIVGGYRGYAWHMPDMVINNNDTIYITEAIIKSIALILNGKKSASPLSSNNLAKKFYQKHKGKNVHWIIAMDNDKAGRKATKTNIDYLTSINERVSAVLPTLGYDWDDLHRQHDTDKNNLLNDKYFNEYRYNANLFLAEDREERALLIYNHNPLSNFIFTHQKRTYAFKLDTEKYTRFCIENRIDMQKQLNLDDNWVANEEQELEITSKSFHDARSITQIGTFTMEFLYNQTAEVGSDEEQSYFRVEFANGSPSRKVAFSGSAFKSAADFTGQLLNKAPGALFEGSSAHVRMMYKLWFSKRPNIVKTQNFVGYNPHEKAYVFNKIAVENGRVININDEDYFPLKNCGMKTITDINLEINPTGKSPQEWYPQLRTAYGTDGLITLAWWVGTFFAPQIRHEFGSYPFIEMWGDPGTGKSRLIRFLWKLTGRTYEGFDPSKSTLPARFRLFTQSSFASVIIESDADDSAHARKFDFDELKPMSDGTLSRVRGVRDNSNTTYEPPFLGAVMLAQNRQLSASKAVLSRILSLEYSASRHSSETLKASDKMESMQPADVSNFLLTMIKDERNFMEKFTPLAKRYQKEMFAIYGISMQRIAMFHGIVKALIEVLQNYLPINHDEVRTAFSQLETMALERQQTQKDDTPIMQLFWGNVAYLNSRIYKDKKPNGDDSHPKPELMNHAPLNSGEIWISLPHYIKRCKEEGLESQKQCDLVNAFKQSTRIKYIDNSRGDSRLEGRQLRFWKFKKPGGKNAH